MRLNMVTRFSYCMESIIQAGNKRLRIESVPVVTNAKTRESRLFTSTRQHVFKSAAAIVRAYIMYKPYVIFGWVSAILAVLGLRAVRAVRRPGRHGRGRRTPPVAHRRRRAADPVVPQRDARHHLRPDPHQPDPDRGNLEHTKRARFEATADDDDEDERTRCASSVPDPDAVLVCSDEGRRLRDLRRPVHPRGAVLIDGLADHGIDVVEVNEPLGLGTADRVAMLQRPGRLPPWSARLAGCWLRLWRRSRRSGRPDAVLVPYLGHFDVLLARLRWPRRDDRAGLPGLRRGHRARPRRVRRPEAAPAQAPRPGWRPRAADVVVVDTDESAARLPAPPP